MQLTHGSNGNKHNIMPENARNNGIARCHECAKLSKFVESDGHTYSCPRCGTPLHFRQLRSLQRSWAFSVAALILLIPANIMPILTVTHFGQGEPDTIMSGVINLWDADLWAIAIIVFVASVLVPIGKLIIIFALMLVASSHITLSKQQCAILYRFIHFIGRWSMLDLFMISILVALVHLGNIALVSSGPAATAFAAVIIFTLLAANSFDPRLIWDHEHV